MKMKNLYDNIRIIPESLQQYITEFDLTLNDIDKMDFEEYKELCGQLEEKPLKQLLNITKEWRRRSYIFNVLDQVNRIRYSL
jgi:hypothetical protein